MPRVILIHHVYIHAAVVYLLDRALSLSLSLSLYLSLSLSFVLNALFRFRAVLCLIDFRRKKRVTEYIPYLVGGARYEVRVILAIFWRLLWTLPPLSAPPADGDGGGGGGSVYHVKFTTLP